ncbi:MAG: hypothetical protein HQM10_03960 [Candidatus Riflebacteria bacterium]|nr:hypothetical protein [Candidatus Riflebacteria bacterium]
MKSKKFRLEEFFSRDFFKKWQHKPEYLWGLMDARELITCDRLRERYGKCTINNWLWGGEYKHSGFREPACKIGAELSQHRYGRGTDKKFETVSPEEIRSDIRKNPDDPAFEFITCVEDGTDTWLHTDVRNHNFNGILWVPKN